MQADAEKLHSLIEIQHGELNYHRKREANVFSLSASIFYTIIGFWIVKNPAAGYAPLLATVGGKIMVSFVVGFTAFFSYKWQTYHFRAGNQHKQVIARAWKILGIYDLSTQKTNTDEAQSFMPDNWHRWGLPSISPCCQQVQNWLLSRRAATLYLGLVTIFLVCLVN
jgi:hypothetical protein